MEPAKSFRSYRLLIQLNRTALVGLLILIFLCWLLALTWSGLGAGILFFAAWPIAQGLCVVNALLLLYNCWQLLQGWIHDTASRARWVIIAGGLLAGLFWGGLAVWLAANIWHKSSG